MIDLHALSFLKDRPGLFAFDMDSTLVDGEGIDELARARGVYDEVSQVTERAMRGEIDFAESFTERLELLRGLTLLELDEVYDRMPLMPGAEDLIRELKKRGHRIAILSGGFDLLAERYARDLGGVDEIRVNGLEFVEGECTGKTIPPIIDAHGKARGLIEAAKKFRIPLSHTVAVGDGANDIEMFKTAAFGIAFCAKPKLRPYAKHCIDEKNLAKILDLL
ncbi:MAG: phosphoserine phosphatase SerB [Cryobacterium sp.]|nr:phosphoserine phosphatase SerB [Oligoflexia bacterium]